MIIIQTQVLTLLLITLLAIIFIFYYKAKLKIANPLEAPTGVVLLVGLYVKTIDNYIKNNMGKKWVKSFAPYIGGIGYLLFVGTAIGIFGITAATSSLSVTFTFGIVTFTLIQITSIKTAKWTWFKKLAEPFPLFIPVNFLALWAPLISISMRLFANILAGSIIIEMIYNVTRWLSSQIQSPINILAVLVGPFFHAYFDLFAGLIQTVVFVSLTVIYISQEQE